MRTRDRLALIVLLSGGLLVMVGASADETEPVGNLVAIPHAAPASPADTPKAKKPPEFPEFKDVSKDYVKIVSTADGAASMYTLWKREKDAQMLAELPKSFEGQTLFLAYTIAGGTETSGVQTGSMYAKWKRYDKRLALIEPNFNVRTTGDLESEKGRARVFTDRVILDVPIVAMGPGGGPVIDMDGLLLGNAATIFGGPARGARMNLARIAKAKAFPENVEVAYELPLNGGRFGTLHYSISVLPESTGYKPRIADERLGYFTTSFRDIGHPERDTSWMRYVNRWHLEKADPKLNQSPPKNPIVFYIEHTTPVRYRRWVREGVLEWNKAFEQVGIVNAVEVYQQDARTGAHMDKDPEDARFNFVLWTNAGMGFAIGPSRVDPRTGQILDADIVMDEGFITSWVNAWRRTIPKTAMLNFGPETLAWLQSRPQWDPRVRLAEPSSRSFVATELRREAAMSPYAGHAAAHVDHTLHGDDAFDGLFGRVSQVNGRCEYAQVAGLELAMFRLDPGLLVELAQQNDDDADDDDADDDDADDDDADDDDADDDDTDDADDADDADDDGEQMLDGVPEWFIGPMLRDVVMHEVGHTLGLRHNFKASTAYGLDEINSRAFEGKAITGSVMDYTPININFEDGDVQGEYTMVTIGPYDYWVIEYGYTLEKDLEPILARVAEPALVYGTDEDSWGSDPTARVFDMGRNPLDYCDSQMRLVKHLRGEIMGRMVEDGESWAKARRAYELLLSRQFSSVGIAANWVGGARSYRDKKGDPDARPSVAPVTAADQRRALAFAMDNAFEDESFGLTPELLEHMPVDKWWDGGGMTTIFEDQAWPIHDRILGIQAATLTMLMNPTTLNQVFDNEFRTSPDEDALTLPEIIWGVTDHVWSELDQANAGVKHTDRKPLISSLRRNLQREHLERLIDLSLPNATMGVSAKPVANLATHRLRDLQEEIDGALKHGEQMDTYSFAHLSEASFRIGKALDAHYIYNTDDIGGGGGFPFMLFGEQGESGQER